MPGTQLKKKGLTFLAHTGIWFFLFLFPTLLGERFDMGSGFFKLQMIVLGASAVLFYFNYFFLIPKFYFQKRYLLFAGINILSVFVMLLLLYLFEQSFMPRPIDFPKPPMNGDLNRNMDGSKPPPPLKGNGPRFDMKWYRDILMLVVTIGAAIAVKASGKWLEEEDKRKVVETEHLKSEMSLLRFQLQPHFFFNTLNNIYALIDQDPKQAQEAVHQLSKLMRHVIYKADKPLISIQEEITFLKAFIEVSKKRIGAHVDVITQFTADNMSGSIPPLLLISLVENAFKHGVDSSKPSFINISLNVAKNQLTLLVRNSHFPKSHEDQSGSGVGVINLRKRLDLLYAENEFILNHNCTNGVYETELKIFRLHDQN